MASSGWGCTHRQWGRARESRPVGQSTGEPQGKHRASHGDAPHNGITHLAKAPGDATLGTGPRSPPPGGVGPASRVEALAASPGRACPHYCRRRRTSSTRPGRCQPEQQLRLRVRTDRLRLSRKAARTGPRRPTMLHRTLGWSTGGIAAPGSADGKTPRTLSTSGRGRDPVVDVSVHPCVDLDTGTRAVI